MYVLNHKGFKFYPYTLLGKTKRVYYDTDPKRLPHQGLKERMRRRKQLKMPPVPLKRMIEIRKGL